MAHDEVLPLQIRYFASARDAAGLETEPLPWVPGETVAGLRARLTTLRPALAGILRHARFAIGEEFCTDSEPIAPGVEVLVLPPASGGAPRCALLERPIEPGEAERRVGQDGAGGIATFVGVVRRENLGKDVQLLEYSAHPPLALKEMEAICEEAVHRFGLVDAACLHRTGALRVGEIAVAIATSAPHRREAFEACSYVIDELKKRVPIWKKETTTDGTSWLGSTP